jgi:hypothetical protein
VIISGGRACLPAGKGNEHGEHKAEETKKTMKHKIMKNQTFKASRGLGWVAGALAVLGTTAAQATMTPISLTSGSYDANVVVGDADIGAGNALNNGANLTATMDVGPISWSPSGNYGSTYYAAGYRSAFPSVGLPMGGTLTSAYDPNTTFAFQTVSENNAAFMDYDAAGYYSASLTLSTPAAYSALTLLAGCSGGGNLNYTINYADNATPTTGSFFIGNWCGSYANNAYNGLSRVFETGDGFDDNNYRGSLEQINLTTPTADPISSISVTYQGGNNIGTTAIFALSGTAVAVPEPATFALAGLGALALICGRRLAGRRS